MDVEDERIAYAIEHTEILRPPRQTLATFGSTTVNYYLLTEPFYSQLVPVKKEETVIRKGKVNSQRPRIVTPSYLTRLEGFGENARRYFEFLIRRYGPNAPGIFYAYKNEPKGGLTIVSDRLDVVAGRLNEQIDKEGDRLAAIIKGVDELWDISLLKFIRELTEGSLRSNITEMGKRGLLDADSAGIPVSARWEIERLFQGVSRGEADPSELQRELDRWDLFPEYEDRFLSLFKKR